MDKLGREQRLVTGLQKIHADFGKIFLALDDPLASPQKEYILRQIAKYMKPLTPAQFAVKANELLDPLKVPPLLNLSEEEERLQARSFSKPNWDTEGLQDDSLKMAMGGGWAQFGKNAGLRIRINQKCFWLFPELTLRGVMVHEASHFSTLATEDIHYSTFSRSDTLKSLPNGCENADNWRIFYQKVSAQLARPGAA